MMESEDDESSHPLGGLFHQRASEDEVFIFQNIIVHEHPHSDGLCVDFVFSFCSDHTFTSTYSIQHLSLELTTQTYQALFNIGMCIATWYWMAYATQRIHISETVCAVVGMTESMRMYWEEVYANVLAEYMYVNKLAFTKITITYTPALLPLSQHTGRAGAAAPRSKTYSTIVPLGGKPLRVPAWFSPSPLTLLGGKDSLVVWHMKAATQPLLVYVADGYEEYALNHRLEDIVQATGCDKLIIRHDFAYPTIGDACRSYLTPCGHPWAALVLFDCVLLALSQRVPVSICLGHERAADEGNNLFLSNGMEVNHQYDKSSGFVELSRKYLEELGQKVIVETPLSSMDEIEVSSRPSRVRRSCRRAPCCLC